MNEHLCGNENRRTAHPNHRIPTVCNGRTRAVFGRSSLGRRILSYRCLWLAALGCLVLFLAIPVASFAQMDISASLAGTVMDQNEAVIPNATVIARNVDTNVLTRTTSNLNGSYRFSINAGTYTITCAVKGFKTFTATDVVLQAGGVATLPVILDVGAQSETVTVSGTAAMVDTESANNQTTIEADLIAGIPVQGRDMRESMEVLMLGATAAGTGASFFIPVTSFNGVSQLTNNYEIDGAAMNDYMHGSAAADFPQPENVSESACPRHSLTPL